MISLFWLAVPLLIAPLLSRSPRPGRAESQIVMAGLGLAAFLQGAGTWAPGDLRALATRSPSDAWFVGLTAGAMLLGACILPALGEWRRMALGAPLAAGLLLAATVPGAVVPVLVGALIGAIPSAIAWIVPPGRRSTAPGATAATAAAVGVGAVAVLGTVIGPALTVVAALVALSWLEWHAGASGPGRRSPPLLPLAATAALLAWSWLAFTVAGSPLESMRSLAEAAPISPAAERFLAGMTLVWGMALAAPWPLDRLTRQLVLLPVVTLVLASARGLAPGGIAEWLPLATMVLVIAAVAAAFGRRWGGAAGALVLLGALRPGTAALAGALAIALVPAAGRVVPWPRPLAVVTGAATALVLASVLRDQVLLSVLLGFGLVAAAQRADRVVASS